MAPGTGPLGSRIGGSPDAIRHRPAHPLTRDGQAQSGIDPGRGLPREAGRLGARPPGSRGGQDPRRGGAHRRRPDELRSHPSDRARRRPDPGFRPGRHRSLPPLPVPGHRRSQGQSGSDRDARRRNRRCRRGAAWPRSGRGARRDRIRHCPRRRQPGRRPGRSPHRRRRHPVAGGGSVTVAGVLRSAGRAGRSWRLWLGAVAVASRRPAGDGNRRPTGGAGRALG